MDRGLLKSVLLLRTVVLAVCDMGKRVSPTVRRLSETAKRKRKAKVTEPNDLYIEGCRDTETLEGRKGDRGVVQLTESAGAAY